MEKQEKPQFVICLKNDEYEVSLEVRKVYRVISDPQASQLQMIRVVDESGEDYLYPQEMFASIELPQAVIEALSLAA